MATLYDIDERITALIDPDTGEITDFDALEQLQIERTAKLENVALWIKNLKADAEMYKAEAQSFTEKQKRAEAKADSLKRYLTNALGGQKFKSALCDVTFRRSESVNVQDITQIPEQYIRYGAPTADKTAIKEAIKAGQTIPGAEIVENTSIIIK